MATKTKNLNKNYQNNSQYSQKVKELSFNKNIDDTYTSGVITKYEKGQQKNKWFISSGILSILLGVTCIVTMVIVGIIFISSSDYLKELALYGEYDYERKKSLVISLCVAIPIIGIFNILVGIKINSFANFTREMLMQKTNLVFTMSILQMLVGGFLICILSFAGYFVGRGIDYGAIYYNRIEGYGKNKKKYDWQPQQKELEAIKNDIFSDD